MQKRTIVMAIREAYELFKAYNPYMKIGKSAFYSLQPNEVLLVAFTEHIIIIHSSAKMKFRVLFGVMIKSLYSPAASGYLPKKQKLIINVCNDTSHAKYAAWTFLKKVFRYLREIKDSVSSMKIFSDSCATQLKKRYILAILVDIKDYAELINLHQAFFAASHGKESIDFKKILRLSDVYTDSEEETSREPKALTVKDIQPEVFILIKIVAESKKINIEYRYAAICQSYMSDDDGELVITSLNLSNEPYAAASQYFIKVLGRMDGMAGGLFDRESEDKVYDGCMEFLSFIKDISDESGTHMSKLKTLWSILTKELDLGFARGERCQITLQTFQIVDGYRTDVEIPRAPVPLQTRRSTRSCSQGCLQTQVPMKQDVLPERTTCGNIRFPCLKRAYQGPVRQNGLTAQRNHSGKTLQGRKSAEMRVGTRESERNNKSAERCTCALNALYQTKDVGLWKLNGSLSRSYMNCMLQKTHWCTSYIDAAASTISLPPKGAQSEGDCKKLSHIVRNCRKWVEDGKPLLPRAKSEGAQLEESVETVKGRMAATASLESGISESVNSIHKSYFLPLRITLNHSTVHDIAS
ncbi:hypothetical protein PR048_010519 [Dryococelus australis]|uniref:Uncharacterized protein n=1 Tax=Dryococelus australis TaxID=614101 RepID=A0ABQ9I423_9NEOP|nr:hypothetical protein PR048_010519 [Dryococelus australis]